MSADRGEILADVTELLNGLLEKRVLALMNALWVKLPPPMAVLLELTHRCPLQCPYCSNPLQMDQVKGELSTAEWKSVLEQAAKLGVLQVHFSGGEPTVRQDLAELIRHAREVGLYTQPHHLGRRAPTRRGSTRWPRPGSTMCSSASRMRDAATAEKIGNYAGAQEKKLDLSRSGCARRDCRSPSTRWSTATTSTGWAR